MAGSGNYTRRIGLSSHGHTNSGNIVLLYPYLDVV